MRLWHIELLEDLLRLVSGLLAVHRAVRDLVNQFVKDGEWLLLIPAS
jgi:hypothetical protein